MRKLLVLVVSFAFLLLIGCGSPALYGRLERLNVNALASYPLGTPDPRKDKDWHGQRLVVSWVLAPNLKLDKRQCILQADLIFTNGKSEQVQIRIDRHLGHWQYELIGQEYEQKGGISAYQLTIINQGQKIRNFQHKLYKPLIDIDELHDAIEEASFSEF